MSFREVPMCSLIQDDSDPEQVLSPHCFVWLDPRTPGLSSLSHSTTAWGRSQGAWWWLCTAPLPSSHLPVLRGKQHWRRWLERSENRFACSSYKTAPRPLPVASALLAGSPSSWPFSPPLPLTPAESRFLSFPSPVLAALGFMIALSQSQAYGDSPGPSWLGWKVCRCCAISEWDWVFVHNQLPFLSSPCCTPEMAAFQGCYSWVVVKWKHCCCLNVKSSH